MSAASKMGSACAINQQLPIPEDVYSLSGLLAAAPAIQFRDHKPPFVNAIELSKLLRRDKTHLFGAVVETAIVKPPFSYRLSLEEATQLSLKMKHLTAVIRELQEGINPVFDARDICRAFHERISKIDDPALGYSTIEPLVSTLTAGCESESLKWEKTELPDNVIPIQGLFAVCPQVNVYDSGTRVTTLELTRLFRHDLPETNGAFIQSQIMRPKYGYRLTVSECDGVSSKLGHLLSVINERNSTIGPSSEPLTAVNLCSEARLRAEFFNLTRGELSDASDGNESSKSGMIERPPTPIALRTPPPLLKRQHAISTTAGDIDMALEKILEEGSDSDDTMQAPKTRTQAKNRKKNK